MRSRRWNGQTTVPPPGRCARPMMPMAPMTRSPRAGPSSSTRRRRPGACPTMPHASSRWWRARPLCGGTPSCSWPRTSRICPPSCATCRAARHPRVADPLPPADAAGGRRYRRGGGRAGTGGRVVLVVCAVCARGAPSPRWGGPRGATERGGSTSKPASARPSGDRRHRGRNAGRAGRTTGNSRGSLVIGVRTQWERAGPLGPLPLSLL